jgi:hypothetical protein
MTIASMQSSTLETINAAICNAKSMQGNCVELMDALHRLSGYDMSDLAANAPFEFAAFAESLKGMVHEAHVLNDLARQSKTKVAQA